MAAEKVAFIIPVHPPHYSYMYQLLGDLEGSNVDLILVFSNQGDYDEFSLKDKIGKVMLPPGETKNIVTWKKFYALQQLRDSAYDYFIVCDAEIAIIKENFSEANLLAKIRQIYQNKNIYGGTIVEGVNRSITELSAQIFRQEEDVHALQRLTADFTIYYWWSDLPVYKRDHLDRFFQSFHLEPTNLMWRHFDHIIYLNFLMLREDFTLINVQPITGIIHRSLESFSTRDPKILDGLKEIGYGFGWVTPRFLEAAHDFLIKEGSLLLYHLDR